MAHDKDEWLRRLAQDLKSAEVDLFVPTREELFDSLETLDEGIYLTDTGFCPVSLTLH